MNSIEERTDGGADDKGTDPEHHAKTINGCEERTNALKQSKAKA